MNRNPAYDEGDILLYLFFICLYFNILYILILVRSVAIFQRVELSDNPAYACVVNDNLTNRIYENVSLNEL